MSVGGGPGVRNWRCPFPHLRPGNPPGNWRKVWLRPDVAHWEVRVGLFPARFCVLAR